MRTIPIGESRKRAWCPGTCLGALLAVTVPAAAQFGGVITNLSLDRPTDPRSIALGESFVAMSDENAALMYNPAGLAWAKGIGASYAQRNNNIVDISNRRYMAYNISIHMPYVDVGIMYSRYNQGKFPVRTTIEPEGTGEFVTPYEYTLGIGVARRFGDRFGIGIAAKAPNHADLYSLSATFSSSVDVSRPVVFEIGFLYRPFVRSDAGGFDQELSAGVSLQNVGASTVTRRLTTLSGLPPPTFISVTTVTELPRFLRVGVAYRVTIKAADQEGLSPFQTLATAEYRNLTNAHSKMHDYWGAGVEVRVYEVLVARLGGYGQNEITSARYGAALRAPLQQLGGTIPLTFTINYAAIPHQGTFVTSYAVLHAFSFELHYDNDIL